MTEHKKKDAKIDYPCVWEYRIVGLDEALVRAAVAAVVAEGREHKLEFVRTSAQGKYCSMSMEITVVSEEDRDGLFMALKGHADVKMVL